LKVVAIGVSIYKIGRSVSGLFPAPPSTLAYV
jgi:hypothetical protein